MMTELELVGDEPDSRGDTHVAVRPSSRAVSVQQRQKQSIKKSVESSLLDRERKGPSYTALLV